MAIVVSREAAKGRLHLGEQAHARVAARTESWLADTPNRNALAWSGRSQHAAEDLLTNCCESYTYTAASALCHALQKLAAASLKQMGVSIEYVGLNSVFKADIRARLCSIGRWHTWTSGLRWTVGSNAAR